eukprot:SAG11_NODE_7231_length_1174_cov_4.828837_1_plen_37_part_01
MMMMMMMMMMVFIVSLRVHHCLHLLPLSRFLTELSVR